MEWVKSLNNAIDYIEENLFTDLTCKNISKHIFSSNFHFQRVFSLLTDMTVREYIRNRRLSLSAQEIAISNVKIIDIAFKYGYSTPESFTKAFTRFHGITPSQAKKEGFNLKTFNRFILKIKLEGGATMDYKIVKRNEYFVCVKTKYFTTENAFEKIPQFWSEYYADGLDKIVNSMIGICEHEESECKKFSYGIGKECLKNDIIPNGFKKLTIPTHTWAVFKCIGPMPSAIQNVWKRIYSEWLPEAKYEIIPDHEIEKYTTGDNKSKDYISEIWIPVKRKS